MTPALDGATSELIAALGRDVGELVRGELAQLRAELADTAREARLAAALLGGAGALGALAAGTSAVALVRLLDRVMPRPLAALAATGLYGAGALTLTRLAFTELRRARQAVPAPGPP